MRIVFRLIGDFFKSFREWWNEPNIFGAWSESFDRLQKEKASNGMSKEYWRIWYEEVCPAYRKLTNITPSFLRHPDTDKILCDMDKSLNERQYY